ncbi:DNA-directed RNA polymerase subunit L [Candidatus Woesearchaeota archaeon]|nr:DNA-directed RNA polymerase subunit L [Candidatus Woesearchaeota archaeon]RLE42345.1 MAG: DNA-directed RNA polymerase subunit L [Candidatus Woesearchaeota archaeon]
MELKILEDKKKLLRFEIKGEGHTLCNALKNELIKDSNVEYATYNIAHPLIGIPEMIVKTKQGTPRDAIIKAIERLRKRNKSFISAFKNIKK